MLIASSNTVGKYMYVHISISLSVYLCSLSAYNDYATQSNSIYGE